MLCCVVDKRFYYFSTILRIKSTTFRLISIQHVLIRNPLKWVLLLGIISSVCFTLSKWCHKLFVVLKYNVSKVESKIGNMLCCLAFESINLSVSMVADICVNVCKVNRCFFPIVCSHSIKFIEIACHFHMKTVLFLFCSTSIESLTVKSQKDSANRNTYRDTIKT